MNMPGDHLGLCPCGHRDAMCHRSNAARYCPDPSDEVRRTLFDPNQDDPSMTTAHLAQRRMADRSWGAARINELAARVRDLEAARDLLLRWCDEDGGSIKGYMTHADVRAALAPAEKETAMCQQHGEFYSGFARCPTCAPVPVSPDHEEAK